MGVRCWWVHGLFRSKTHGKMPTSLPNPSKLLADNELATGVKALIHGLGGRPELNGAIGVLIGEVEVESGRAPVKLMAPLLQAMSLAESSIAVGHPLSP